jgi:hypothetical protein
MESSENKIEQASVKDRYRNKTDAEGYIRIGDFATPELHRQSKNVASLLDGDEGQVPENNLGKDLKYTGSSGNYSDMKIHIDDLETFIDRVKEHYR